MPQKRYTLALISKSQIRDELRKQIEERD